METGRPIWHSRAWHVAGAALATLVLLLLVSGWSSPAALWVGVGVSAAVVAFVIVWAGVRTRAQRRRYDDALASWAAERATQAERLRIARELHDLVSHGLGLITVRAAAARTVDGPAGVAERAEALADIEATSRATTAELRRMLTVLRTPGPAPLQPADVVADLPAIVGEATRAGLPATLSPADLGPLADLSPGAQLTVCAVVREALDNAARHAGPSPTRVVVLRRDDDVLVDVHDDGPRPGWRPHRGAGRGLDGLRERLAAMGGTLVAGPDDGGYRVVASIPDGDRS